MAKRRRNEYNYANREANGSVGISDEALRRLESGNYNGRTQKYRTSSEQVDAVQIPALNGVLSNDASQQIWESNFARRKKVDTDRARRSYEHSIGHNAPDFRDLRNRGYESTRQDFDFSYLDDSLKKNHTFDFGLLTNRGLSEMNGLDLAGKGPNIAFDIEHPEMVTPEVRQQYIDKFGAPMEEVIPAYQRYVDQWEKNYAAEHPYRTALEDIGSAFERGNAAATARIANRLAKGTKVADYFNSDEQLGKVNKVENKRNYIRNNENLTGTQKTIAEGLAGGGDFLSSTATGSLLTGGVGVANPETGYALAVEPAKWLRALVEAYNKFGLGATQEYSNLKNRGVSEDKAQNMADIMGLITGATAGVTSGLGSQVNPSASFGSNVAKSAGRGTLMGGGSALIRELVEKGVLGDESTFELGKQAYMAQGMSEEEATTQAWKDLAGRTGISALVNGLLSAGTTATTQGVSNAVKNAIVPSMSDDLNSVWATQPAIEGQTFPRLTGTVDGTQALPGSGNLPALVDNIYPIQMPGTQGVIPMPGTNGVILPTVGEESAPVVNSNTGKVTGWESQSPRYVKKLEGEELEAAIKQIALNEKRIAAYDTEINLLKKDKTNYYRGNLKKAVQAKIRNIEKEQKAMAKQNKELEFQKEGGLRPMLDMLTPEDKNAIYSTKGDSVFSDINFAAKFAGDTPEARQLAYKAQNAVRQYIKTGSGKSVKAMSDALTELDNLAKSVNATYTSAKGNEWDYGKAFGEQAEYLKRLRPVADIYNAEVELRRAARKAAQNAPQTAGESAPIEAPVEAPAPTPIDEGRIIKDTKAGASVPVNTPEAPQPPQNVNAVPELTNEPNFSLVGEPYTPQEVPNVQPTPPTNNVPPTQEVPNMEGGKTKTSQYYKNTMRGTEGNRNLSDEEYADRFPEENYKYFTVSEAESVNKGRDFIKRSGGPDGAIQKILSGEFDNEEKFSGYHLDALHVLSNELEQRIAEMQELGQDVSAEVRLANKLHNKAREWDTYFGQGLQANQKWKRSTPQGAYDDLISQVNRGIDKKKTTGYTRDVNRLAEKIEDAIESTDDKASLIAKIKDIFAKDREKNPYNTEKAEQLVLDLVGGDKNTKKGVYDLIEDAGRLIKKEMGVSTLSAKDERAILNLLNDASKLEPGTRPYNELVSRAMTIVDDSLPVTMSEKAKALLYDNMLASIKTMFTRNFGGNVIGNAIDAMAAPFQVGADALVGKITGVRTRALTGKSIVAAAKGMGHGFKDWGQDIGYSIRNKTAFNTPRSGQEELADVLKAVHKTWKTQSENKVAKALTHALSAYDYIIRKGMEGGDRPIYEAQYAATKAELYHVVDKYGDAGLRKGLPTDKRDLDTDDLIEAMAINEALEAVLQNDSKMKDAAKNIKEFFKKSSEDMLGVDIASMSHAPFVEVPANMASNFFKLTPIGWVGNAARTIGEKKKYGSINQRRFTGELGLNVLGGLLAVGGIAAADKFISGPYSDDPNEKKLQQNNGYIEYALQTPDGKHQWDLSDVPYIGPGLKFTKMEREAYKEGGVKGLLNEIPAATGAATVDTLYQGLNRLTGGALQYNGNSNLVENAVNNIKSSVGSMGVPQIVRQTAQFLDPYKRDLGDYGTSEYNKNLIINGIPLLRQSMLEPKIDTAGQPVPELGGSTGVSRFLNAYVSPWKVSHPHENMSAVQEYVDALKTRTSGEVNPQMRAIGKKDLVGIKGYDKENYNHADLRKLQEEYYQLNTELGNAVINDPWFTNLSDEKQGKILKDLWEANLALVKENFIRDGLTEEQIAEAGKELYSTDNKLAATIKDDDENHTGLLKWLHDETDRNDLNAKYGTNMNHDDYVEYNNREEGYAEQRMSETEKAKALGMNVTNYEKYEAEYPGGAQAKYDDTQAAKQYGFVNSDKTANTDAYRIGRDLGNGDPNVIQAYSDYKKQGIKSSAYSAKADYLIDEDRLTDEQKGMVIAGSQDGTKINNLAEGAQGMYEIGERDDSIGGYAGIYYYYLLKNLADADGGGSISKDEREAFFRNDSPELDELWTLSQEMYNYLMKNLK